MGRASWGVVSARLGAILLFSAALASADWYEWRGPLRTGESPAANPPIEWAEGKNVRWKLEVPGLGLGTPIVWGDAILLTTAVPSASDAKTIEWSVMAVERKDGKPRWRTALHSEVPHEGHHQTNSFASASLRIERSGMIEHS